MWVLTIIRTRDGKIAHSAETIRGETCPAVSAAPRKFLPGSHGKYCRWPETMNSKSKEPAEAAGSFRIAAV
jgi:hypothetical protein